MFVFKNLLHHWQQKKNNGSKAATNEKKIKCLCTNFQDVPTCNFKELSRTVYKSYLITIYVEQKGFKC